MTEEKNLKNSYDNADNNSKITKEKNLDKLIIELCKLPLSLDVANVARVLGISKQNAYRLCHSRNFPCVKIGKRLVIPKKAFEKWMDNPFIFERKEDCND